MKYCSDCTCNHPVIENTNPNVVELIDTIILREGYTGLVPFFNNQEVAINLDEAEKIKSLANGTPPNSSMDFAVCLKEDNSANEKMLLVELKLNISNPNNLINEKLIEKVLGSSALLSHPPEIFQRFIFVVKTNQIQETYSRFFRMIPKINSNYFVYDLETLKAEYF